MGFPGGSAGKEFAYNAGDLSLILGLGRSPGEGNGTHSSILAWRIPRTKETGRLWSMRSQRVRQSLSLFHFQSRCRCKELPLEFMWRSEKLHVWSKCWSHPPIGSSQSGTGLGWMRWPQWCHEFNWQLQVMDGRGLSWEDPWGWGFSWPELKAEESPFSFSGNFISLSVPPFNLPSSFFLSLSLLTPTLRRSSRMLTHQLWAL